MKHIRIVATFERNNEIWDPVCSLPSFSQFRRQHRNRKLLVELADGDLVWRTPGVTPGNRVDFRVNWAPRQVERGQRLERIWGMRILLEQGA